MTSAVKEFVVPTGAKLEKIGDNAFYIDTKLEKVDLGDSVKSIGSYAFSESLALTSVNLGHVESVGDYAFAKSTALESFSFPDTVTAAGTSILQNSPKIKMVHVGKNVPALDADTFVNLEALEKIDVDPSNKAMRSDAGVLFTVGEQGALTLTAYPAAKADESYDVPAGTVAIAYAGMAGNQHLKHVTLPEGLTSLADSAFNNDRALETVALPQSLETVGSVFVGNTAVETVELGPNLTTLDDVLGSFSLSPNLRHIVITGGKDLAITGNMGMDSLETVYLGPGVVSLDGSAFPEAEAPKLKTVVVNADLTSAPAGALPASATVYVAAGHDATAELLRGQGYTVKSYAPMSVTLAATPASAKPGDKVSVSAQVAGGIGSNQYRFVSVAADGSETELAGWSDSATLAEVTVPESGSLHVRAYVRDASQLSVAADLTVGEGLSEGSSYAVPAQLLTADGSAVSPLDELLDRADGAEKAVAHVSAGADGSADVTLDFAAGRVTALEPADGGEAAAVATPSEPLTLHVAKLTDRIKVKVTSTYADAPTEATLALDLSGAQAQANLGDLKALLDQAAKLNPTRYTEDTWKALADARDAASAVYDQVGAKQDAVNAAADKLRSAISALKSATGAEWPANGTYNVAISGQNMLVANGRDMVGTSAQIEKDETGTYLLLTLSPATVGDTIGTSAEMDASMVKQFLYYKGSDSSTQYDAGTPVSTSADGKTATYKLQIDDVAQTVTLKVWWKSGSPIAQPLDPILTLGKITPAVTPDATDQSLLAAAYNEYAALDLASYEDGSEKDAFTAALKAAREVLSKPESTKDEVSAALKKLDEAAGALKANVDVSKLEELVGRVGGYVESDYTAQSWKPFSEALTAAQKVIDASKGEGQSAQDLFSKLLSLTGRAAKPTAADINKAYDNLMKASLGLVHTSSGGNGGGTVTPPSRPTTPTTPSGNKVEASAGANGSVALDRQTAAEGDKVTLTPKADEGYHVSSVKVTGKDGRAVAYAYRADGTFAFDMPEGAATVRVEFAKNEPKRFSDVNPDPAVMWQGPGVDFVSSRGIMGGYANPDGTASGTFGVNDPLTRAQFAQLLYSHAQPGLGGSKPANGTGLPDVADGQWYTAAANWAVANKVINGSSDADGSRTFLPDDPVTLEQMVAIVANLKGADVSKADASVLDRFVDKDAVSPWARQAVAWAVQEGLFSGSVEADGLHVRPTEPITRGRVASVLMNAFQKGILK